MAEKIITTYRAFDIEEIINRSIFKKYMRLYGGVIFAACSSINIFDIKDALDVSSYSLLDICASANRYSKFGPYEVSIRELGTSDASLVYILPTHNLSLGDFAGYNHLAGRPGSTLTAKEAAETEIWIQPNTIATFPTYNISLGEIEYPQATGITYAIFDTGNNLAGKGQLYMGDQKNSISLIAATDSALTEDKNFYGKVYATNSFTEFAEDFSNCVCKIPDCYDTNLSVRILPETFFDFEDLNDFTMSASTYSLANGTCGFTDLHSDTYSGTLIIVARLWGMNSVGDYEQVGDNAEMYNDSYEFGTNLTLSAQPGNQTDVSAYGYKFVITLYALG